MRLALERIGDNGIEIKKHLAEDVSKLRDSDEKHNLKEAIAFFGTLHKTCEEVDKADFHNFKHFCTTQ